MRPDVRSRRRADAGWAALARLAMVQAQYLRGEHTLDALRGARRAAAELARTGVHAFESEAVLMAGRLAAELGGAPKRSATSAG